MPSDDTFGKAAGNTTIAAGSYAPIDLLRRRHDRQREFCGRLSGLIDDPPHPGEDSLAGELLEFIIVDLPGWLRDEDELLAPLIGQRCSSRDEALPIVAQLIGWHRAMRRSAVSTIDGLYHLAMGSYPLRPLDFVNSALGFADDLRKCVDWEDRVVLPLASARLTDADKRTLQSSLTRWPNECLATRH